MFRRPARTTFYLVIALASLALLLWVMATSPTDAIAVREGQIDREKLQYVVSLERDSNQFDPEIVKTRRYIPIRGKGKNCIIAIFDPPIPVNQNQDDIYCFDNSTGEYVGKL